MKGSARTAQGAVWLLAAGMPALAQEPEGGYYEYDPADETVPAAVFDNPNCYDADLARIGDDLWLSWLEFFPGKGDHVFLGRCENGKLALRRRVSGHHGQYAHPTITVGSDGQVWLSYEAQLNGQWDVLLAPVDLKGFLFPPAGRVSHAAGPDIRHRIAADAVGGMWIVWQSDANGQFDILARRISKTGASEPFVVSDSPARGDWHPDVAVGPDGTVYVVWDGYDGDSYNVYARQYRNGTWGDVAVIAGSPAFEGRARIAAGADGRVWVLWEEGAEEWGKRYTSRMRLKNRDYFEITDTCGPLHRFRRLRLALLDEQGRPRDVTTPLPMPSIDKALRRPDAAEGSKQLGAFYERGRLTVDAGGRVWVLYRHYYVPWLGIVRNSHKEEGWGVYARCLDATGWSKLYRFDVGQGDGMQSLAAAPHGDGIDAVWTTGRTDRRRTERPRGIVLGTLTGSGKGPAAVDVASPREEKNAAIQPVRPSAQARPASVGGKKCFLFFGDLHRHTDLSLCFVPGDGTIDDTYRYAIDVARLDFLGITDHSRDIAQGDALSQLWWRCRKQVTRHELEPDFLPYFSYERSRPGADHNVISLRPDMLRPHTYPHPEFWKECDDDTITIPHQTITDPIEDPADPPRTLRPQVWDSHDNARRPLLEIYQGCRDRSIEHDAHEGLARRYLFGFIASSDHMSTSCSYAGVWAEQRTRESIFRAMQARRTFGATDEIRLLVRAGEHWMGEHFTAQRVPPLHIEAEGTAPIKSIDIIVDGEVAETLPQSKRRVTLDYDPGVAAEGFHYLYVRLEQKDGNRAWSSPIWIEAGAEGPEPHGPTGADGTAGGPP